MLQPRPDATLAGVRIYQFDDDYRLVSISYAERGVYLSDERWLLQNVVRTVFDQGRTRVERVAQSHWSSVLSPSILNEVSTPSELFTVSASPDRAVTSPLAITAAPCILW